MDDSPIREARLARLQEEARTSSDSLESFIHSSSEAVLAALLENPNIREPILLLLLARRDLPRKIISTIGRNASWTSSYSIRAAVAKHPATPRQIAVPLFKHLFVRDLLSVALTPGLAADLRRLAEDSILGQTKSIPVGQRKSLARRASNRLAAGMLLDSERQVIAAALQNPAMSDQGIAQALSSEKASPGLTEIVLADTRWMTRRPVKLAVIRSRHLSLAKFANLLKDLTTAELADLGRDPRLPANLRHYVAQFLASRKKRTQNTNVVPRTTEDS